MKLRSTLLVLLVALATGCVTPPDYTAFREDPPRSILVLPPLNESVDVNATYSWLTTVTMPIAETGYYVFPVAMVDAFLKDNGLPTAGEMHGVDVKRLGEVFGADAVLYVTILDWGQEYIVLSSNTVVHVKATLVDADSGTQLWEWERSHVESSGGSGSLIADAIVAVIEQVADTLSDQTHLTARQANFLLFKNETTGLPYGPYHPKHATDPRLQ